MSQPRGDTYHLHLAFIGHKWSYDHDKPGKQEGVGEKSGEYHSLFLSPAPLTECHLPSLLFHHRGKRHHLGSSRWFLIPAVILCNLMHIFLSVLAYVLEE